MFTELYSKVKRFFFAADCILVANIKRNQAQKVSIYGAGVLGIAVFDKLGKEGIVLENWYDGSLQKEGCMMGNVVKPPECLTEDQPQVLVVASEIYAKEIIRNCEALGYKGRIFSVLGEYGG